jgi:FlaA1/EpsC-like NDP-sugar epimerase
MVDAVATSSARHWLLLALDGLASVASLWVAMLLRFEGSIPPADAHVLPMFMGVLFGARVLAMALLRLHKWSFRLSGLIDGARVWLGVWFGTGLFLIALYLVRRPGPPRSVVIIEALLSGIVLVALRFSPRLTKTYVVEQVRAYGKRLTRTVIVGAGSAGELLLRDLRRSARHNLTVVGFLDDNPTLQGVVLGGMRVLGTLDDLSEVAKAHNVEEVLIAIPRLEAHRIREILSTCGDLKLRFRILPVSVAYLEDRISASMLQDLAPDDLLPRPQVAFASPGEDSPAAGRVALVTGAAGSIGSEICRQLLLGGIRELVMVDINENGLYLLQRQFDREFPNCRAVAEVADIRERARLISLFARFRPNDVFHAAAHKHVPLMETAPCEAVKNNVLGTRNVAEAADAFGSERFVYISTDKAVRPSSVMGASKRVGEMLVRSMARRSATRFCAVRFGNVLGSSGSVVPLFRDQIAAGGPVTVTHPEVRRYFMTISEAVGLVLRAAYKGFGELCVLDMGEQIKILDLAHHMITMVGKVPEVDIPIAIIGLRPGEKLYEELLTEEEESTCKVDAKIFTAASPQVRADLGERVAELGRAALDEDDIKVHDLLVVLVPSYQAAPASGAPAGLAAVR